MTLRIGQGFDVHPLVAGRRLVLGGVDVPSDLGLVGHSDADAVAHAVVDALLGAVAMGDIGQRFGVDDPEVAGADSMSMVRAVVADLATAGWRPHNLDVTVVAERPRLAAHRDVMRSNLAAALGVEVADVSVKASTADRLGSIGRGEGIACWAVCTVVPT